MKEGGHFSNREEDAQSPVSVLHSAAASQGTTGQVLGDPSKIVTPQAVHGSCSDGDMRAMEMVVPMGLVLDQ